MRVGRSAGRACDAQGAQTRRSDRHAARSGSRHRRGPMGRVLRQARLHHDPRRAALRADRSAGAALLRGAPVPGPRLPLRRRAAARAAAARVAGARAQPLARASHSPLPGAVPVELQPLQGARGGAAPGRQLTPEEPVLLIRTAIALAWLLHFLPLSLLAPVGEALGAILYFLGRERRKVCLTNLARCLPDLTEAGRVALARAHFRAFGRSVLARAILWWAP